SPVQIHGNRANLPRGGQLQKPSVMLHDHGIRFAQWIGQITLQKCPEKLALPHRCRKNRNVSYLTFVIGHVDSFGGMGLTKVAGSEENPRGRVAPPSFPRSWLAG